MEKPQYFHIEKSLLFHFHPQISQMTRMTT